MESNFSFPNDFKRLIKNLSDENQWSILECLINKDNKAKYTTIQKTLEIPKGTLNYHLKELQKGGWLRRWSQKGSKFKNKEGSFYEINQFGLKILEGGLTAMNEISYQNSQWEQLRNTGDSTDKKLAHLLRLELTEKRELKLENIKQSTSIFISAFEKIETEEEPEVLSMFGQPLTEQKIRPHLSRKKVQQWI